ncbi:transporter (NhaC family) [Sinobacterium caligoides]|uniref:Transporter (NhaC family) n=1 Tax=Sinobacterium caligoides TaxID=933926 RepID=A0A3N2DNB2_9GAMM|nr:Na+/H+ antiporter NhaC family protein [Sinobacterium caligoides]ROS01296.1 transporter (NhaC family) [Sinobacterium caligoides]
MELISYHDSALSLLAPVVALGLVLITRRVVLSLLCGALVSALLLVNGDPLAAAKLLGGNLLAIFWDDGAINSWNVYILTFLILLGILSALLHISGGTQAFASWARKHVKTKRGTRLFTTLLGIVIFIDDYFNALAVGQIARPLTDQHGVSRAKLAYLIDSTSAPVCVISPLSSWGAYIIGLIATVLAAHHVNEASAFNAFIEMIPMNLYAIFGIIMVFAVAYFNINIGQMKVHEANAAKGELYNKQYGEPAGDLNLDDALTNGSAKNLLLPIAALTVSAFFFLMYTGGANLSAAGKSFTVMGAFAETDVPLSLLWSGSISVVVAMLLMLPQGPRFNHYTQAVKHGAKSMLPAVIILICAWLLVGLIGSLETGKYLASLVDNTIPPSALPAILFIVAGLMALATGTSWGTFGIMLPIAGDMAAAADIAMILPMMAAVLAGAVFGDHCSPISDTTILSSTGAGSHHIDHVTTQLPYALLTAAISFIGYLVFGFTSSISASLIAGLVCMVVVILLLRQHHSD